MSTVRREQRFSPEHPCPICGRHDRLARGKGVRCTGFLSENGDYAHCSREEFAGGLPRSAASGTYGHWLGGVCMCGVFHGDGIPITGSTNQTSLPTSNGRRQVASKIVATYAYRDESGDLLFETVRYQPKRFSQRRPNGRGGWIWNLDGVRLVPYRLPEITTNGDRRLLVVEGERDADRLHSGGVIATTFPLGAGKWRSEYTEHFRGRHVVLIPDNDNPGRRHMTTVATSLYGLAASIKWLDLPGLPEKGDASDWLDQGGTLAELKRLIKTASDWSPPPIVQPSTAPTAEPEPWPVIAPEAFYGLTGEIVTAIDPTTEADPVFVLVTLLTEFGCLVNRGPHLMVGDDRHGSNIFCGCVGDTSTSRKGTSRRVVERIVEAVDPVFVRERVQGGLSSGEGLIWAIRDELVKTDRKGVEFVAVEGVSDKRLLCFEEEFSQTLKVAVRQGNTITEQIRRAWDSLPHIHILTKNSPARVTNPHVSMIVHITAA
jgi:hypothetical protein